MYTVHYTDGNIICMLIQKVTIFFSVQKRRPCLLVFGTGRLARLGSSDSSALGCLILMSCLRQCPQVPCAASPSSGPSISPSRVPTTSPNGSPIVVVLVFVGRCGKMRPAKCTVHCALHFYLPISRGRNTPTIRRKQWPLQIPDPRSPVPPTLTHVHR